jgi:hypothetical protein
MKPTHINPLRLEATDVTGMHVRRRSIQPSSPAGAVARMLATEMALPTNVPWVLRDNRTGGFLDDDLPIGDQLADDSQVAVVPKAHLG